MLLMRYHVKRILAISVHSLSLRYIEFLKQVTLTNNRIKPKKLALNKKIPEKPVYMFEYKA